MTENIMVTGVMMFIITAAVFYGWFYYSLHFPNHKSNSQAIWWLLAIAFFIRLAGASAVKGYPYDINCFTSWSETVFQKGIGGFYRYMQESNTFIDYPPGYMYVLYALGALRKLLGVTAASGSAHLITIKLPAILADLACGWIIYKLAMERFTKTAAGALAFIALFNPVLFLDSALWGQVDSVFALLVLISLYLVYKDRLPLSAAFMGLALLVKPQALLLGPVFLWVFAERFIKDKKAALPVFLKSLGAGLAALAIGVLPFCAGYGFKVDWVIKLYINTLTSYPFASVNAFNLFALFGGNWAKVDSPFLFMTYNIWSNIFIAAAVVLSGVVYFRLKDCAGKAFLSSAFINIALFTLAAKMHERYMVPSLLLLLAGYILSGNNHILILYGLFSLSQYVNVGAVLGGALSDPQVLNFTTKDAALIIAALLLIGALAYMLYILLKPMQAKAAESPKNKPPAKSQDKDSAKKIPSARKRAEPAPNSRTNGKKMEMILPASGCAISYNARKYYLMLAALTLVYAVIAFFNLGDRTAPQTYWKGANGDTITIALDKAYALGRLSIFQGQSTSKYHVEFSTDGTVWGNAKDIEKGYVFQWIYEDLDVTARYIKLTMSKPGTAVFLNEIAVYAKSDKMQPLPIVSAADRKGNDIKELHDEQKYAVYKPTYLNGTYFDEIYHARTAFENMHNMEPTETSHPPLGKYIIALGTSLFGMTPFGWRIMGTLFGIFMIPLFFYLALVVFKNARYAMIAAALLTVDFMHFTQTRIATIDSYAVVFIIIMYIFMYKYYQTSFYETDIKNTLKPLFLSGLFFGIGAATKWICIYSGAGLFIIFCVSLIKRILEYNKAKWAKGAQARHIREAFAPSMITTLVCAAVFFVVLPACIYILAYFPFAFIEGHSYTIGDIINYTKSMFRYHSTLTATHPYSSPWYSWPFMYRPMWYYSGGTPEKGLISSISAFGNPAVWWVGILAFFISIPLALDRQDKRLWLLITGYLSQYLPWMFVTRVVFIYHYFASVPFVILIIVYCIYHFEHMAPKFRYYTYAYLGLAGLMFLMFYPVISGFEVSKEYVRHFLRWFNSWVFYSG